MGSNCNWCSLGLAEIYRDSWNKNCQIQAFAPLQVGIHDFLNCMTHATTFTANADSAFLMKPQHVKMITVVHK